MGEFFEYFVSGVLFTVMIVGVPGLAIYLGMKVADWSYRNWLGWITGILLFRLLMVFLPQLIEQIPGVGWKFIRQLKGSDY